MYGLPVYREVVDVGDLEIKMGYGIMRFRIVRHMGCMGLLLGSMGCYSPSTHVDPVRPAYDAKKMAEGWYTNNKTNQDNDDEVGHYGYPVYQTDQDNPDVYVPVSPHKVIPDQQYPQDNDAEYYYYPLYFSE